MTTCFTICHAISPFPRYNLIEINSGVALFSQRYKIKDERNVLKFLLADESNPDSLLSSLKMVRENIRTSRDVVPGEMWELINELDLYARQNIRRGSTALNGIPISIP